MDEKYASAHDLRRSFGTRWASRVKPTTLQLLMRHESIETTLKYYVAQDTDAKRSRPFFREVTGHRAGMDAGAAIAVPHIRLPMFAKRDRIADVDHCLLYPIFGHQFFSVAPFFN